MSVILGVYDSSDQQREVSDNNGYPVKLTGNSPSDGQSNLIPGMGYNNTTFDRWRNNTEGTLLTSAARTATTSSPLQTNYNAHGILVNLDVSAASGTGGLKVTIKAKSLNSPSNGDIQLHPDATAVTALGRYTYVLYPGTIAAGGQVVSAWEMVLPRSFYVSIFHADSSSYTYSVTYSLIL